LDGGGVYKVTGVLKECWRKTARFFRHARRDDAVGVAAKTAFFFLLSLFPLMMLAGWALSYTGRGLDVLQGFVPAALLQVFADIKSPIAGASPVFIVTAVWAASSGVWALMNGVKQAYGERGKPELTVSKGAKDDLWKYVKARGLAVAFTLGFLAVLALTLALLAVNRSLMLLSVAGAIFLLLFALYTLTPGTSAKPRRTAVTSAFVTVAWLIISWGFEFYMRRFARYGALYGAIGAFMGLSVWVFLICIVIILGAELGAL
jgi:membrane protein